MCDVNLNEGFLRGMLISVGSEAKICNADVGYAGEHRREQRMDYAIPNECSEIKRSISVNE